MSSRETVILPLQTEGTPYFYKKESLIELKKELEEFLSGPGKYMDDRDAAERFLGCQEIQANNSIEGYNDDASTIRSVIADAYCKKVPEKRRKIINNLYQGYQKILRGEPISENTLKELYDVLSNGLLADYDLANMGRFYRNGEVEINFSGVLSDDDDYIIGSTRMGKYKDYGVAPEAVSRYMDSLFLFLDDDSDLETPTDYFIKSQIAHHYFVYVHPYFDVNGRTGRTMSMWYLLNNEAYPYIIFNRAIPLFKRNYNQAIRDTKKFKNMTFFLNYMLSNVKTELEKEYAISSIESTLSEPLDDTEYQTLRYVLSMNGLRTSKDFASFYNRLNDKKGYSYIDEHMIEPLIDKDVLTVVRHTRKGLDGKRSNYVFEINPDRVDSDPGVIKRLHL